MCTVQHSSQYFKWRVENIFAKVDDYIYMQN